MNHYTKSIWVLTLGMAALVIAFLSPLFWNSLPNCSDYSGEEDHVGGKI